MVLRFAVLPAMKSSLALLALVLLFTFAASAMGAGFASGSVPPPQPPFSYPGEGYLGPVGIGGPEKACTRALPNGGSQPLPYSWAIGATGLIESPGITRPRVFLAKDLNEARRWLPLVGAVQEKRLSHVNFRVCALLAIFDPVGDGGLTLLGWRVNDPQTLTAGIEIAPGFRSDLVVVGVPAKVVRSVNRLYVITQPFYPGCFPENHLPCK